MTCRSSRWRKSSYSEKENCVEVAFGPAAVAVRDSKNVDGPVLGMCIRDSYRLTAAQRQAGTAVATYDSKVRGSRPSTRSTSSVTVVMWPWRTTSNRPAR